MPGLLKLDNSYENVKESSISWLNKWMATEKASLDHEIAVKGRSVVPNDHCYNVDYSRCAADVG